MTVRVLAAWFLFFKRYALFECSGAQNNLFNILVLFILSTEESRDENCLIIKSMNHKVAFRYELFIKMNKQL